MAALQLRPNLDTPTPNSVIGNTHGTLENSEQRFKLIWVQHLQATFPYT